MNRCGNLHVNIVHRIDHRNSRNRWTAFDLHDCKSLHDALKSTKQVGEKRLRLEIRGIKQLMEKNIVKEVKWQTSHTQLADCLTKRGASSAKPLQVLQEGKISLQF